MMWLLAELYHNLPEAGDLPKPKLVFFFDEAHLLFDDAPKAFLDQIQRVVRLIRSKGVGVYMVTQTPKDVPNEVLAQLGNRIQHALRAHTPDDDKALKATVRTYPKTEFYDLEETLTSLGIGEAVVTVLDARGTPTPVVATRLIPPASRMAPLTPEELQADIRQSDLLGEYGQAVDRESAREMLAKRMAATRAPEPEAQADAPEPRRGGGMGKTVAKTAGGGGRRGADDDDRADGGAGDRAGRVRDAGGQAAANAEDHAQPVVALRVTDNKPHVVLLPLPQNHELLASPARADRPRRAWHPSIDRLPVEVEAPAPRSPGARRPSSWRARSPAAPRRSTAPAPPPARPPWSACPAARPDRSSPLNSACARLHRLLGRLHPVHRGGHLARQQPLRRALPGIGRVLRHRGGDLIEPQEGEELEIPLHVPVVGVDPELVELVRTGARGIEPDVAGLALPELGAGGRGDEREDQPVRLAALPPADQLDPRGDVAPLVAAAHLELAALGPPEMPEVVAPGSACS